MKKSFGSSNVKSLTSILSRAGGDIGGFDVNNEVNELDQDEQQSGPCGACTGPLLKMFDKRKRVYRKRVNIRKDEEEDKDENNFVKNFTQVLIVQAKRNKKQQSKGSQVANLLLFLTISFVIATVPYSTFYALKLNLNMDMVMRNVIINVLSLVQYLRHAANFLIYLATSSIIKNEFKTIFIECKSWYNQHFG
jgi:hypothetical protein